MLTDASPSYWLCKRMMIGAVLLPRLAVNKTAFLRQAQQKQRHLHPDLRFIIQKFRNDILSSFPCICKFLFFLVPSQKNKKISSYFKITLNLSSWVNICFTNARVCVILSNEVCA